MSSLLVASPWVGIEKDKEKRRERGRGKEER
jgi:hypothetical protein